MNNLNITRLLGFDNLTHKDIPFVDIIPHTDVGLFLDPILIDSSDDPFIKRLSDTMTDFFGCVADACIEQDLTRLSYLLQFGAEKNSTHLGMSRVKSYGKGASEEILMKVFTSISRAYIHACGTPPRPSALNILTRNFGDDRMSDLLTNILYGELYSYTASLKKAYNIPQGETCKSLGRYWCPENHSWMPLNEPPFIIDGVEIILVPKTIVRKSLCCNVGRYLWYKYIPLRQTFHQDNNTALAQLKYKKSTGSYYVDKPTKRTVYAVEISGNDSKVLANQFFSESPRSLDELIDEYIVNARNGKYTMSDFELDRLIADKMRKIS